MVGEHAEKGQLLNETIRQFLTELERTQWKIVQSRIGQESIALREQVSEEKQILRELHDLIQREQKLLARMEAVLDVQERCVRNLAKEEGEEIETATESGL
ncbi:MAG: hypothetical protein QMD46_04955 [Methanomicrobiales archaeon]|nr:hypothetical protein [Methanomicrobiales archaeon]MDI6877422.1 hypothetical protein [Methanomicrobiales archaeon]